MEAIKLILMGAASIMLGMYFYDWSQKLRRYIKEHGLVFPTEYWKWIFKKKTKK